MTSVPPAPSDQRRLDDAGAAGLAAWLDPRLDPAFDRPALLDVDSAWHGHLPFAAWLVGTVRPGLLVELGTRAGVSYAGFCHAVAAAGLPTRCFAVDICEDDKPAGPCGNTPSMEFRAFHDQRYGGFSRLLRMRPDDALSCFDDASIDLLHIHGGRRYEDVAHHYAAWLPKLAPEAVVLFHDTNVREHDCGVWRFWTELAARRPCFEFLHGHGLGIVAPNGVPPALAWLFRADAPATTRLRARFARLGERWEVEFQRVLDRRDRAALAGPASEAGRLRDTLRQLEIAHARQADETSERQAAFDRLRVAHDRLRDELAVTKADRHRMTLETERLRQAATAAAAAACATEAGREATLRELVATHARLQAESGRQAESTLAALRQRHEQLAARHAELATEGAARERLLADRTQALDRTQASLSWRLTRPLRLALAALRGRTAGPGPGSPPIPMPMPPPLAAEPAPAPAAAAPSDAELARPPPPALPVAGNPAPVPVWRPIRRLLFIAGEPGTPGATYRTARAAAACAAAGYQAEVVDIFDVNPDNLAAADLVVLWRASYSGHVQTLLALAAAARTRVVFDVDDLIVQPSLAVAEIIDGIRTTFVTEAEGRSYFQGMQRTLTSCDLCTTTTTELAVPIGRLHPIVHVLPNSFDAQTERASRRAVRLRAERPADGLVRLGYAGGTRTHQKDFATIAAALAQVLEQRPQVRLVLFRDGASGQGLVLIEEFPELLPHAGRIEWRDMVPLSELPAEIARFDVSLCPLEQGNPFCEAKSELKYFEAALAGVCLVATPTGPFRRAVRDGVTGWLPEGASAWETALLALVDQPDRRRRLARAAYHDVLWQFGPRRQSELWAQLLIALDGGAAGARTAELALRRGAWRSAELPSVPDSQVLYAYDALGEARVTVGMTSYNYEDHLDETLGSVLDQTLADIDLVVVDDGSRDGSVALLLDWAERNRLRFNRIRILRTADNAGLGGARNVVFDEAETPWVMVLDSDNRLAPQACERLLAALDADPLAAFAYPRIRQFGGSETLMGEAGFDPFHLASGNYIDAMAMIAKWAWAAAGGYYVRRDAMGWEDFTLWCRLVELGQYGLAVPEELAFYRVHAGSMVNAITEQNANKRLMVELAETRHPWLRLRMRDSRQRR